MLALNSRNIEQTTLIKEDQSFSATFDQNKGSSRPHHPNAELRVKSKDQTIEDVIKHQFAITVIDKIEQETTLKKMEEAI
jgi:hypothetical protein